MYILNKFHKTVLTVIIALAALLFTACDNPADSDEEEHEHLPVGAVLFLNGQEIVRYENGEIAGQITVTQSEETELLTMRFIAEDGDLFQPDEPEHSLGWEVGNTAVAEVEQHAEDGKWSFHIIGKTAGETEVTFQLLHGDHSDFTTLPVPVTVPAN